MKQKINKGKLFNRMTADAELLTLSRECFFFLPFFLFFLIFSLFLPSRATMSINKAICHFVKWLPRVGGFSGHRATSRGDGSVQFTFIRKGASAQTQRRLPAWDHGGAFRGSGNHVE